MPYVYMLFNLANVPIDAVSVMLMYTHAKEKKVYISILKVFNLIFIKFTRAALTRHQRNCGKKISVHIILHHTKERAVA